MLLIKLCILMHLGSLESTQEELGLCLKLLLYFFQALQTSYVHPNPMVHA